METLKFEVETVQFEIDTAIVATDSDFCAFVEYNITFAPTQLIDQLKLIIKPILIHIAHPRSNQIKNANYSNFASS